MEDKSQTETQIANVGTHLKGVVSHQESFSEESSRSESSRKEGNKNIVEKSANVQSEATSQTVQKTGSGGTEMVNQRCFTSSKERIEGTGENGGGSSNKDDRGADEFVMEGGAMKKSAIPVEPETEPKHSSSRIALELINKYIDVPEPEGKVAVSEEAKNIGPETGETENGDSNSIEKEMMELEKELEELKKEEERCEESYGTRERFTSTEEQPFDRTEREPRFKNIEELIRDYSSRNKIVANGTESLPSGNLVHLIQSVQIAQELNRLIKQPNNGGDFDGGVKDENSDSKPIDLEKLFTPATDSGEVAPSKNRKMYASSSFYSPHHPTVQDQVELARRISSSLCDISNKQSKGQSMYVNRMKRSVKWVHGGDGESEIQDRFYSSEDKNCKYSNSSENNLKLVMNPLGKVQDLNSLKKQGLAIIQSPLSPKVCFDLVKDLTTTKGKGAELFAKRRKKSEKWIVDENTVKQSNPSSAFPRKMVQSSGEKSGKICDFQETSNRSKLFKSPWEAALDTNSVVGALRPLGPAPPAPEIGQNFDGKKNWNRNKFGGGYKSDLYMPKIPKGWNSKDSYHGMPTLLPPEFEPPQSRPIPDSLNKLATRSRPEFWNLNSWNNYNTAPMGWKHDLDYYRPVTFSSRKQPPIAFYSADY